MRRTAGGEGREGRRGCGLGSRERRRAGSGGASRTTPLAPAADGRRHRRRGGEINELDSPGRTQGGHSHGTQSRDTVTGHRHRGERGRQAIRRQAFRAQAFRAQAFLVQAFRVQAFRVQAFRVQAFLVQAIRVQAIRVQALLARRRGGSAVCGRPPAGSNASSAASLFSGPSLEAERRPLDPPLPSNNKRGEAREPGRAGGACRSANATTGRKCNHTPP